MIKHFCDICGDEIDQKTERKSKQINNLRAGEAEFLPELKVLRKVVTGETMNYRGIDICEGCAVMLSDGVNTLMQDMARTIANARKNNVKACETSFGDRTEQGSEQNGEGL